MRKPSESSIKASLVNDEASQEKVTTSRNGNRSFRVLATLLWAASTIPTTILLYQSGRVFGESTPYTPTTQALRYGLIVTVLLWAIVIISRGLDNFASRPLGVLLVLAFAIFFPAGSAFFHGQGSVDELFTGVVSLVIVLALFTLRLSLQDLSVVGGLGAATGAVSLAMAQLRPASAFAVEEGGKALAGPFNNSNYLGTILVLSLPFALLIRKRLYRLASIVLIVSPILMGGSKTSIATLVIFVAVGTVLVLRKSQKFQESFLRMVTGVALVAMMLLPLVVNDPSALTRRGAIWIFSRNHLSTFMPFGAGRSWFENNSVGIGFQANHAHHLLLDPLIVGGLPYAGVVFALLFMLIRSGVKAAGRGEGIASAMFGLTLVLAGGLGNFFILDMRDLRYTATGFVIVTLLSIATWGQARGNDELSRGTRSTSRARGRWRQGSAVPH